MLLFTQLCFQRELSAAQLRTWQTAVLLRQMSWIAAWCQLSMHGNPRASSMRGRWAHLEPGEPYSSVTGRGIGLS